MQDIAAVTEAKAVAARHEKSSEKLHAAVKTTLPIMGILFVVGNVTAAAGLVSANAIAIGSGVSMLLTSMLVFVASIAAYAAADAHDEAGKRVVRQAGNRSLTIVRPL